MKTTVLGGSRPLLARGFLRVQIQRGDCGSGIAEGVLWTRGGVESIRSAPGSDREYEVSRIHRFRYDWFFENAGNGRHKAFAALMESDGFEVSAAPNFDARSLRLSIFWSSQ